MGRHSLTPAAVVTLAAYERPFTIASNFARTHKEGVAEAASLGWITVFVRGHSGAYTDHRWRVTKEGLAVILDTRDNGDIDP